MALSPLEQAALAAYTPTVAQSVGADLAAQYPGGVGYSAPGTGPAYDEDMVYRFDTGNKVGVPDGKGGFTYRNAAPVVFRSGEKYVLASKDGTNILGEASTPEELQKLIALSDANKSDWDLFKANSSGGITPGTQLFGRHPVDMTPIYLIGGGMLAASGAGALGLGAGGGGAGAGLGSITGASAGNAALASLANVPIAAGLPATTAGLGAGVGAIGGVGGTTAGGAALGGGASIGGIGGGAGFAGPGITVIGKPGLTALQAAGAFSPGAGAGLNSLLANNPVTPTGAGGGTGGGPNDIIEVVGKPVKPYVPPITIPPVFTTIPPVNAPQVPTDLGSPKLPGKSLSDKLIDYTRLGGYGANLIDSLFGGGGGGGGQYSGSGGNSIFSAKLPEPSLPGGVSSMSARQMPEQNWYEYGFNPEQSFFNTSAPGYTPEPGKTPGMARGGDFAVRGPGDGRSDSIPARLSDGEYVIDAETVALLGNGSPKAGAERLDDFRVSIRKHKGRNLAQGKFSVNAKKPEAYLAGGRA